MLFNIRDYLAGYQETHGTPRSEYSFASLISLMGQSTGRALLALFYIIVNIAPVAEVNRNVILIPYCGCNPSISVSGLSLHPAIRFGQGNQHHEHLGQTTDIRQVYGSWITTSHHLHLSRIHFRFHYHTDHLHGH